MESFKKFVSNESAATDIESQVITVFVILILVATIGGVAWNLIGNMNETGVDANTVLMVGVISVISAVVIVLLLIKLVRS